MVQDKSERRKSPRANAQIVTRYQALEESRDYDLSQSRNVSQDGLLLTTNRMFHPGTHLAMNVSFPFLNSAIEVTGDVVESREVMENLIYETHIHFHDLEKKMRDQLAGFVDKLAT